MLNQLLDQQQQVLIPNEQLDFWGEIKMNNP